MTLGGTTMHAGEALRLFDPATDAPQSSLWKPGGASGLAGNGAERLFVPFYTKSRISAKTGSGQT
jgi:hypothetical protein|eukprot:COSAG06_NODE_17_length_34906_cov_31.908268_24_plen_65_part_00